MSRSSALATLLVVSLSVPCEAAEDESGTPSPSAVQTTKPKTSRAARANARLSQQEEAKFKALVDGGDRALAAGRLNDAADAYEDALDIKLDARLLGRLGLVLSMFQQTPKNDIVIARVLHAAVSDAAGASSAERKQFFEAYERVRKRVCRLEIMTSDVDATVLIGGRDVGRSDGAFWTFISPGKTNITATLTGREDLKKTAECVGGESMLLDFEFPNPAQAPPQVITIEKEAKERRVVVREAVWTAPPAREPSPPKVEAPSRFGGGIGPVMVWGAAPSVSVGISASGFYRRQEFSAVATVRGAWSLGDIHGLPIDVFSASAVVGPCVQWGWIDGCAFGGAMRWAHSMDANKLYEMPTDTNVIPALGLGVGVTYPIKRNLSARLFADATALTHDWVVRVVSPGGEVVPVWQTSRFIFSVSASLMFGR